MEHYDVCVIGGGPAGYAAAMRALDLNKRTILIEKRSIGGTGIYNGALSSKTLWEISQRVANTNKVIRKKKGTEFSPTWEEIMRSLNEALLERKHLLTCHMQMLRHEGNDMFRYKRGHARFTTSHTIRIDHEDDTELISAEQFILATGSRPRSLPEVEVDERTIITSDGISNLTDIPESLVIVGAGVIGCEFATIFSDLGCNEVHLIDRADRILPFEDQDVSELITKSFKKKGIIVHGMSHLENIEQFKGRVRFRISGGDKSAETHVVEKALISIGRVPNLEFLDISNAGLFVDELTEKLKLDRCNTNMPHIHVVGDANGQNMLVNMGEQEARNVVESYWGLDPAPMEYENVSSIMFLDPPVAGVGMNEMQCQKKGISYRVARLDYACIARAIAMRNTNGFIKLIVSADDEMKVLGIRVAGEHASSAIQAVALMIKCQIGLNELASMMHPHPSIIEGVQECARMLLNSSLLKSNYFGDKMKCYSWSPNSENSERAA